VPIQAARATDATAPGPVTAAILDFEAREDMGKDFGKDAASLVGAHLTGNPGLWLVERAELDKLLGEQALGLSGDVLPDTASKLGHLTGAKVLITGRAFHAGSDTILVAKIIGVETGRVYGEMVKGAKDASTDSLAESLAAKIGTTVAARAESLVARVVSQEDRAAAIKAAIKDARRPSVAVNIPERHFGSPTIDPAAQTELMLYLRQIGCELRDSKSSEPAEIDIDGEAFSENAGRRGSLISCRARVEIKVREHKTGKILLAERETSVAIDTSEQIAAKNALAQASAGLASRIIPQFIGK
jgi:hypothetical protein